MDSVSSGLKAKGRVFSFLEAIRFQTSGTDHSDLTRGVGFGDEADQFFAATMGSCQTYLEFGSGASTFAAAELGIPLVTVESDSRFLEQVESVCDPLPMSRGGGGERRFIHADIGRVRPWGQPLWRSFPDRRRMTRAVYPTAPWNVLGRDFRADVVLIDGRFRVACALATVILQQDQEWIIMFDDYRERPEYWQFEAHAELVSLHGRMAEFRPRQGLNLDAAFVHFRECLTDYS
jgi:hypothetical protein